MIVVMHVRVTENFVGTWDDYYTIEADSVEQVELEWERAKNVALNEGKTVFAFKGELYTTRKTETYVEFMTLEEWVEKVKLED